MSALPTNPREVIEHLRRYEFGLGASLEGDGLVVVENMRRRYRSLLATIAEDLNSKESHFILELIQNADDNSYAKDLAPSLTFIVGRDLLVVVNNEIGFLPSNVAALCSAGESSKKNKTGYIGEKGIGFKSVFKVTDAPEIHSNGYHFQFNRSDPEDLLGYVVPHWKLPDFPVDSDATTFVLPARPGKPFPHELLNDLDATLLLFLKQLRRLAVKSVTDFITHIREDSGPITTLTALAMAPDGEHSQTHRRFFRTSKKCDMSLVHERRREDVKETELVLAFPLTANGEAAPDPGSPTYAFLPIRDFGFSFCIQADFVLISSREGVHEDLEWNISLRDSIAAAFVEALETFKSYPRLSNTYLRFLPEATAIHDPFFHAVVEQFINALKRADSVPVEGGQWRRPEQVIVAPPDARALFSAEDSLTIFGAEYPSTSFEAKPEQLHRIGCRTLKPSDVVAIFTDHAEWLAHKPIDWKAKLFAFLASPTRRALFIKELKAVACLPVAGSRFASPQSSTVFYPLAKGKKYDFEHELTILDEEVYEAALAVSPDVRLLFDSLGVRTDDPYEFVQGHILKRHAQNSLESNRKALIGHVRYIRDKLDTYLTLAARAGQSETTALAVLKAGLWIGTKKEDDRWVFQRPGLLYLGKSYGPDFDIETLLGDTLDPVLLVSDAYLSKKRGSPSVESVEHELESWRRFFHRIGVNDSPLLTGDGMTASCSPELKVLLASEDNSVRRVTLECLDRHWHKYEGSVTYVSTYRRSSYVTDTPFKNQLRATKAPTKRHTSVPLSQAYMDSAGVRRIAGGSAIFVNGSFQNEKFLDAAGITYRLDAAACVKRLKQIRDDKSGATRDQIRAIYRQLELLWPTERATIENAFATEPLILVGYGESQLWVCPEDACWQATNVKFLDAQHLPLQGTYSEYRTFFTKQLSVPPELPLSKWVDALALLPSVDDWQERQVIALTIYRRLSRELGAQPKSAPDWLQRFATEPLFLDHRRELVSKSSALYANDDTARAALFEDEQVISFLAVAPDHLPSIANLLSQVGVGRVSSALAIEPTGDAAGEVDQTLTQKLRTLFGHIARVVYSQSHERFETAIKEGLFQQLQQLEVQVVPSLQLKVSLNGVTRVTSGDAAPKDHQLLLHADAPSRVDHLAMEIRRILRLPQGQVAVLSVLLRSGSMKDADDYLLVSRVSQLPAEEQALLDDDGTKKATTDNAMSPHNETVPASAGDSSAAPEEPAATERSGSSSNQPPTSEVSAAPPPITRLPIPEMRSVPEVRAAARVPQLTSNNNALITPAPVADPRSQPFLLNTVRTDGDPPPTRSLPAVPNTSSATIDSSNKRRRRRHGRSLRLLERPKTGRLLSYVEFADANGDGNESDPEVAKRKRAVEKAAVDHFVATAAGQWKHVQVMENPNNPGFDIRAIAYDDAEEFIEIKGQTYDWTEVGVALTPTELLKASKERERYWLCVVEYATDENRRQLHLVNNPFGIANQFRFDKGWKRKATTVAAKPTRPAEGLFVTIAGQGKARIVGVKGKGKLIKLAVQLADGQKCFKLFEPNTMQLSVD